LLRPGEATIPPDWLAEFEAAARRPLEMRFRYAFLRTCKPVLDDAPFRAFELKRGAGMRLAQIWEYTEAGTIEVFRAGGSFASLR
jgi:hypothetical protein